MPCAVILTALRVEYIAVSKHLTNLKEEIYKGNVYERGNFTDEGRSWEVGVVEIGAGNSGAAVEAERAIAYFNPDVLLFIGVAGGIKDVNIGDVVASTKIYGYESGKAEEIFKPRPEVGLSTHDLVQRARAEARKPDWLKRVKESSQTPNVLVAPIAAGEKVIASTDSDVYKFIRSNYGDAVAVEMEGFGLLKAAHANQRVSAMAIRGISDLIDGKAQADATGSQEIASCHASAFAFQILAKLDVNDNRSMSNTSNISNIHSVIASAPGSIAVNSAQNSTFITGNNNVFGDLLIKTSYQDALAKMAEQQSIRQLVEEALSDEDLSNLCQDKFPKVYMQFTTGQTRSQRIRLLVDHVKCQLEIPKLLDAVEQTNHNVYSKFKSNLSES